MNETQVSDIKYAGMKSNSTDNNNNRDKPNKKPLKVPSLKVF